MHYTMEGTHLSPRRSQIWTWNMLRVLFLLSFAYPYLLQTDDFWYLHKTFSNRQNIAKKRAGKIGEIYFMP